MITHHKAYVFEPNIAANTADILRKTVDIEAMESQNIVLLGFKYSLRVLQSEQPEITPMMGLGVAFSRLNALLWNSDADIEQGDAIYLDAHHALPVHDEVKFIDGIEIHKGSKIHLGLFLDNLSSASYTTKIRLHVTWYYDLLQNTYDREARKWYAIQKALTSGRI